MINKSRNILLFIVTIYPIVIYFAKAILIGVDSPGQIYIWFIYAIILTPFWWLPFFILMFIHYNSVKLYMILTSIMSVLLANCIFTYYLIIYPQINDSDFYTLTFILWAIALWQIIIKPIKHCIKILPFPLIKNIIIRKNNVSDVYRFRKRIRRPVILKFNSK